MISLQSKATAVPTTIPSTASVAAAAAAATAAKAAAVATATAADKHHTPRLVWFDDTYIHLENNPAQMLACANTAFLAVVCTRVYTHSFAVVFDCCDTQFYIYTYIHTAALALSHPHTQGESERAA